MGRAPGGGEKEGKVGGVWPRSQQLRQALPVAFKERFGVTLEYLERPPSARLPRDYGPTPGRIYTVDLMLAGSQTMATILYREAMLDPPAGALPPDAIDGSKWKTGKLWFSDPGQEYVLRLCNTLTSTLAINTREVKPDDLHSMRDLLDPKWKGRMSFQDPTLPGSGSNQAAQLYLEFGEEFIRRLYIDQKPMISRDTRQLGDCCAQHLSISFGAVDGDVGNCARTVGQWRRYNLSDWPEPPRPDSVRLRC